MAKREWNDFGNAERVIDKYGEKVRWVRDEKGGHWAVYDGRKWESHGADTTVRQMVWDTLKYMPDDELSDYDTNPGANGARSMQEKFLDWAKKQHSARAINGCMTALSAHPTISAWPGEFDEHRHLMNFDNGTLDTDTLQWMDHDAQDMLTRCMPVAYNPDAKCDRWRKFLEETIEDPEIRHYLHKAIGYTLTGRSDEKMMLWLYGPANTGKSIVTQTLAKLFGQDYGVTANEGALRPKTGGSGPSPEIDSMKGKRYVAASETGHGEKLDEALIKRLTGRDTINSRTLYAKEGNWNPECVIWVASNQYPQPHGDDDAIWGRFRPIPFTVTFGPENPLRDARLQEKLDAELEGIAAWAVEGLRLYLSEGLPVPAGMTVAAEEFRSASDDVARFIAEAAETDRIRVADHARGSRTDLYNLYQVWAKSNGSGVKAAGRFYERLRSLGFEEHKTNGKRLVVGIDVVQTGWVGNPGSFYG
jgi:putative DNA primase/helicase